MNIVGLSNVQWEWKEESGIHVGRSPYLPNNKFADIVYARIPAGGALNKHYHLRPDSTGYVACFLPFGGRIRLHLNGEVTEHNISEPTHITFFDREVHGIENLSTTDLLVEVICAPRFEPDEETPVK